MRFKPLFLFTLLFSGLVSCKTGNSLFGKKSLHEQYAQKLENAGLNQTILGQKWTQQAHAALSQPFKIQLPYSLVGYFPAEEPRALGIQFDSKRGEKLHFNIRKNPANNFTLFIDLWQFKLNNPPGLLLSVDTTSSSFEYEIDETGTYILRIQPELLVSGDYTLSISIGPSLSFPVSQGRIGSFWGADRDGGQRSHEGIDIFAPRGTPVLAAADGIVNRVEQNNLGGNVIFMRPSGKSMSLYYAHLDKQLAEPGQMVQKGDTIGLVGNTGNARTTSPHLHFGIYSFGGAIDPYPFVNPDIKKATPPNVKIQDLQSPFRLTSSQKIGDVSTPKNQVVNVIAAGSGEFLGRLPNNLPAKIASKSIQSADNQLIKHASRDTAYILEAPHSNAPRKMIVGKGASVDVLGYNNDYALVRYNNTIGWLLSSSLK